MLEDNYGSEDLITSSMRTSEISNDCVEEYQTIFTALDDELLQVEHFFAEPQYNDMVENVLSFNTFSLQKCLNFTNGDAQASNLREGERPGNGLLTGNLERTTDGLSDAVDSLPDICEDYLLDLEDVDIDLSHMENIDRNYCQKEMSSTTTDPCFTGESNPLTRIFKFRTKPRGRNMKRGKPATYDYLKVFSSEVSKLVFGLSDMQEEKSVIVTKKRINKPKKGYIDESFDYSRNRRGNNRSSFENSICEIKIQKGRIGRRKRHKPWSIPEVLKLIEGVSELGVGKWTEIKRVYFSTFVHRSSVDLKDKWRNLLRASCKSAHIKGRGDVNQNNASPTVPQHILRRVEELSVLHPYPRQVKVKVNETI